jgi:hypothetical protein
VRTAEAALRGAQGAKVHDRVLLPHDRVASAIGQIRDARHETGVVDIASFADGAAERGNVEYDLTRRLPTAACGDLAAPHDAAGGEREQGGKRDYERTYVTGFWRELLVMISPRAWVVSPVSGA